MRIREGMIDVPGGRVWYRSVGEGGIPLLCLHGGPGMTHNYIEPLEDLGDRRRVIFYDQLGCGRSDKPDDTSLWTVPHFVREVEAVRSALELDRFHLFGSSWGGQLSMQYILDYQPASLVSLLMSGSPASMPRWVQGCAELFAELPADVQDVITAARADRLHVLSRVHRRGQRVLQAAPVPSRALASRPRAHLRGNEPGRLRDDERAERVHRHGTVP